MSTDRLAGASGNNRPNLSSLAQQFRDALFAEDFDVLSECVKNLAESFASRKVTEPVLQEYCHAFQILLTSHEDTLIKWMRKNPDDARALHSVTEKIMQALKRSIDKME